MKILSRYVVKEHIGPLVFALTALTSLLLLNYIAKRFGDLVGKGLPWSTIGEFFMLSVPFTFAMTLPMAVLVSVLYAFSRLASENEVTALKASGIGMPRVLVPVVWGGFALSLLMIGFHDQVLPRANHRLQTLTGDIARKKPTFALREQVINEVVPGRLFLRAGHVIEETNQLREVTIYDLGDPARRRTIYADSGVLRVAPNRRDLALTLYNGTIQQIPSDNPGQLQRLFYAVDHVRVRDVINTLDRSTNESGMKGDREMSVCELTAEMSRASREQRRAQRQLEAMLVAAAREASTGRKAPVASPDTSDAAPVTLGGAYCAALGAVARIGGGTPPAAGRPRPPAYTDPGMFAGNYGTFATSELTTSIASVRARIADQRATANSYLVEIHKKFALSAACVIFVLLGAPIALRFPRGGVGLVIGVSLVVFALDYVGLIAGEALADRDILSPFWAMWSANGLFLIVAAWLLSRMGREGATNRGGGGAELADAVRERFRRALGLVGLGGRARQGSPLGARP